MLDIGWGELLVIGIVALVVIGPKELPALLRTLGQGVTKIRRMASEFQGQFQDAMREAELAELKEQADKLSESVSSAANLDALTKISDDIRDAVEKPIDAKPAEATSENTIGAGQMPPIAAVAPVVPPELEPKSSVPESPAPEPAATDGTPPSVEEKRA